MNASQNNDEQKYSFSRENYKLQLETTGVDIPNHHFHYL